MYYCIKEVEINFHTWIQNKYRAKNGAAVIKLLLAGYKSHTILLLKLTFIMEQLISMMYTKPLLH